MLDLTTIYKDVYFELKLFDGTVLKIKRPTQSMAEFAVSLQKIEDDKMALDAVMSFFVRILNRNTTGKVFTVDEIKEDYDVNVIGLVIRSYFDFWNKEVGSKVDFQQGAD